MGKANQFFIGLWALFTATGLTLANTAPVISSMPVLSDDTLVANDGTVYTATLTATDADGYNDIRDVRILFNLVEYLDAPANQGRGYLVWGVTDGDVTYYNDGTWITAAATGGGRWGYLSSNWGGTTYITPVGCNTSVSGAASGGSGSRTVTFSFRAKPAWAASPLINDADAYSRDSVTNSGWQENPDDFAVVASTCGSYSALPQSPVVGSVAATSANISIAPTDSGSDKFAIRITSNDQHSYVQTDGTLGLNTIFRTKSQWGTVTVTGLESSTAYAVSARAYFGIAGICPSDFGPQAFFTTQPIELTIDLDATGQPISPLVTGSATRVDIIPDYVWGILDNRMARGIAGGLDADTYNWKDMSGQGVGHSGTPGPEVNTTLDWLRNIRDHNATPLITANARGIGPLASSGYGTFYYTDTNIATVSQLAADWVRYINFIVPNYRQGDTLPASDQAILDSIEWYGEPKLLAPGEAPTPKVTYWEIGNEPEVGLPFHTPGVPTYGFTPTEYVSRYKQIAAAMLAVDPTIKLGPCIMEAHNGQNAFLTPLLSDSTAPVHLIGYHPYGALSGVAGTYGDTESSAEKALKSLREQQIEIRDGMHMAITNNGRDPNDILLIASEWNASNWKWEREPQITRMSHALGVAENMWNFGELGLFGATYWSWWPIAEESPGYKVFKNIRAHFETTLLTAFTDDPALRIYVARNDADNRAVIWALNFSKDADKNIVLDIPNHIIDDIQAQRLANVNGQTHLFDVNATGTTDPLIDWIDLPAPAGNGTTYALTLPQATITVIDIQYRQPAKGDFDLDDDVDMEDFGAMQKCMSGTNVPQNDPACFLAHFDTGSDVDAEDMQSFIQCLAGANMPIPMGCAE